MTILMEHLNHMLNREVVIVMDDGMAFKGLLKRFDSDSLVLSEVMEAKASDARWREALVTVPASTTSGASLGDVGGIMLGDTGTSMLKLTSVVLMINHISRIWTWAPEKPEGY